MCKILKKSKKYSQNAYDKISRVVKMNNYSFKIRPEILAFLKKSINCELHSLYKTPALMLKLI